jgi:hypothetical protein
MKKLFIPRLTACIIAMAAISQASAQSNNNPVQLLYAGLSYSDANEKAIVAAGPLSGISIKAVRNFVQSFKHAEQVQWHKASDGIVVCFTENGIKARANYDKTGNCIYNMRSYTETHLPKEIRAEVKRIFYDFSITCVNEITQGQKLVYLVQIQDKKHHKTIRVCEGEEMETIDEFEEP